VIYRPGDTIWHASFNPHRDKRVPCPVCYGKGSVVLILGNNDQVTIECDYCGKGSQTGPRGYDTVYEATAIAVERRITEVRVKVTTEGEKREYLSANWALAPEDIFTTEAEALARAQEKAAAAEAEEVRRGGVSWEYDAKSYAWKAGYHLRQIERSRRDMAYAERMISVCKAKATPKTLARFGIES
jgi:hypothetical protein